MKQTEATCSRRWRSTQGSSIEIIGGLLGHTVPATTKRYAQLAALPVQAAGEKVAQKIDDAPIAADLTWLWGP